MKTPSTVLNNLRNTTLIIWVIASTSHLIYQIGGMAMRSPRLEGVAQILTEAYSPGMIGEFSAGAIAIFGLLFVSMMIGFAVAILSAIVMFLFYYCRINARKALRTA